MIAGARSANKSSGKNVAVFRNSVIGIPSPWRTPGRETCEENLLW